MKKNSCKEIKYVAHVTLRCYYLLFSSKAAIAQQTKFWFSFEKIPESDPASIELYFFGKLLRNNFLKQILDLLTGYFLRQKNSF